MRVYEVMPTSIWYPFILRIWHFRVVGVHITIPGLVSVAIVPRVLTADFASGKLNISKRRAGIGVYNSNIERGENTG